MKNITILVFSLLFCQYIFSQHVIETYNNVKVYSEVQPDDTGTVIKQEQSAKADFTRWYNYGETMQLFHGLTSVVNSDYLFSDTTILGITGYAGVKIHNLGDVLDVSSPMFNNNTLYPNALKLDALSRYYLDSLAFHCVYQRGITDTTIVDTLIFELSVNAGLGTVYFAPATPVPVNLGTDTVYIKNLPYTYQSNTLNIANKQVYKIPLTYQDYIAAQPTGNLIVQFATTNLPEVQPGRFVVSTVSFKPGYTWIPFQDNITAKNSIMFKTRKQLQNQFPHYIKRDFNVSYTIPTDVRYNFAGSWNGLFIPSYAYMGGTTSTYPYEHHLIYYKIRSRFNITANYTASFQCYGQNDGYINLNVAGGTPPYNFLWSNGQTTQNLQNLTAGNYRVTITDADSVQAIRAYGITQPASSIQSTITSIPTSSCGASDGEIVFSGTQGGTPPYSVLILDSDSVTQAPNGLPAGIYTVKIIDANGCTLIKQVGISETGSAALNDNITPISCYGESDGSISLSLVNPPGTPSYLWSNGQTTSNIQNLSEGTYSVSISDGNCMIFETFVISEPDSLNITASIINPTGGLNNGMIVLTVSGGTPNYSYSWSSGQTTKNISNLDAGTYTVTVTDSRSCVKMKSFTLTTTSIENSNNDLKLEFFPNPVSDNLSVVINGLNTSTSGAYKLLNIHGQLLKSGEFSISNNSNVFNLNFSDYASGFYLVEISIGDLRKTVKIFK
ncbi:MAG: T9SS type A sorting domain-containing protein [Bacteroidales bacterium]|nr:T9SS type A sorting domain-containing protein [Bacteroidales bacterium]